MNVFDLLELQYHLFLRVDLNELFLVNVVYWCRIKSSFRCYTCIWKMTCEEVLNLIFSLLEDVDLASCMAVCNQWRDVARDDYLWKCLCAKRWPSICKRSTISGTYYKLYRNLYERPKSRFLTPRLSFDDLEFFLLIFGAKTHYSFQEWFRVKSSKMV